MLPSTVQILWALGTSPRPLTVAEISIRVGAENQQRTIRNRMYELEAMHLVARLPDTWPEQWRKIGGLPTGTVR